MTEMVFVIVTNMKGWKGFASSVVFTFNKLPRPVRPF